MSETTNPTPAEVLAEFRALGKIQILLWQITSVHIRNLTARGVYLAGNALTPEDEDEFDVIEQELANRMMGRVPFLK